MKEEGKKAGAAHNCLQLRHSPAMVLGYAA